MWIQIYVFSTATVHNLHLYFIGFANETVKAQRGWLTNSRSQSREAETLGIGLKTALQQLLSSHGSSSPSSTVHPLEMISWTAFVFILNWDRRKVLSVPVASPFLSVTAVGWVPILLLSPFRLLQSSASFAKSKIKLIPFQNSSIFPSFISKQIWRDQSLRVKSEHYTSPAARSSCILWFTQSVWPIVS